MTLVRLDEVLCLAPRAIDVFVEILGRACEIGDHEGAVGALRPGLDTREHTAETASLLSGPGPRGIIDLAVTPHRPATARFRVLNAADRDVLGEVANLAEQHPYCRQGRRYSRRGRARRN